MRNQAEVVERVLTVVTETMNQRLLRPLLTDEGIKKMTFQLGGTRARGRDNFYGSFYQ